MWPPTLPKLREDEPTQDQFNFQSVVPMDLDVMSTWMHVGVNPDAADWSRRNVLLYTMPEADEGESRIQVAVRLQGFVDRLKISPLGNWNRSVSSVDV